MDVITAGRTQGKLFQLPEIPQSLFIACGSGALSILRVQMEGKRELSAKEFLAGYKGLIGSVCT
jgi:methionyl-tRNA formyltransferase